MPARTTAGFTMPSGTAEPNWRKAHSKVPPLPLRKEQLSAIGATAREPGRDLLDGLADEERSTLTALLERVAKKQGLQEGVHPGYRSISVDTSPKNLRGKGKA
jgi:hypothetical protein